MTEIPQKELRNQVGSVLRRAESGEEFTITVSGRPVAELGPLRKRTWVGGPELERIWASAARSPVATLENLDADLADPFA